MIVVGTLNVGCISLTIQGKCDLKALSSEKIMINKSIDYSHITDIYQSTSLHVMNRLEVV